MFKIIMIILIVIILYICLSSFTLALYAYSHMLEQKDDYKRGKQIVAIFLLGPLSLIWFFIYKLIKFSFNSGKIAAQRLNNRK